MEESNVKITVSIPHELYNSARDLAKKEGVTVTHIIKRALKTEQYLKNQEEHGNRILIDDGKMLQRLIRM